MKQVSDGGEKGVGAPRLMKRDEAVAYLRGLEPEAIGVARVPAKSRKVRYDQAAIDEALNRFAGIISGPPCSSDKDLGDPASAFDAWASGDGALHA